MNFDCRRIKEGTRVAYHETSSIMDKCSTVMRHAYNRYIANPIGSALRSHGS